MHISFQHPFKMCSVGDAVEGDGQIIPCSRSSILTYYRSTASNGQTTSESTYSDLILRFFFDFFAVSFEHLSSAGGR